MSIQIQHFHPLFAIEIRGVQVCQPMDDATFREIRAAFEKYSVVVFRGQVLDAAGHAAFGERFGHLEKSVKGNVSGGTVFSRQSNFDVATGQIIPEGDLRLAYLRAARRWHSDSSFRAVPSTCSIAAGYDMPPEGGNTEFAHCGAAYDDLPAHLQMKLLRLTAGHDLMHSLAKSDRALVTDDRKAETPPVDHPMVRINIVTGRKSLFVGSHLFRVNELPEAEGNALIEELNHHVTQQKYVYSHSWKTGDIVIWDNRAVLHRGTHYDASKYKRLLQRVTVAGNEAEFRREHDLRAVEANATAAAAA